MDILYIVMPAYNEEDNILDVVTSWYPILEGKDPASRLVIADSGSVDRTHELLENFKKDHPQLEILSDTGKQHGPKVIALYDYAIKNGADFIFQTDSDGQTLPSEFDAFWQMRHGYKGIFGHRVVRGDGKSRAFVEKVVCFLLKCYFHVKVPDYNLPNIMMTTYFVHYGEEHAFREVTFRPRQGGTNSINIKKIVKIGWKALGDFRRLKKAM